MKKIVIYYIGTVSPLVGSVGKLETTQFISRTKLYRETMVWRHLVSGM